MQNDRYLISRSGKDCTIKPYAVTLDEAERNKLTWITSKGSPRSWNVISALNLLNCDVGEFNDRLSTGEAIADILRIRMPRVDRMKKRLVKEVLGVVLGGRQWHKLMYARKADGTIEAHLAALIYGTRSSL